MAMASNSEINPLKKQTADDCINACLESLVDQVSPHKNCLKSIENINKPVKFFGISISKSLNVSGLTDFIKTQAKESAIAEHVNACENNSSDVLEIFPSPSRFYKEICDTSKMKCKSKFLDIAKDKSYDYLNVSNLDDIDNKENSFSLFTCQNNKILDTSNDHDLSDILVNMSVQDIEEEREKSPFKNSANKTFFMNEKNVIRNSTPKRLQNCKPIVNEAFGENLIESPSRNVEIIPTKDSSSSETACRRVNEDNMQKVQDKGNNLPDFQTTKEENVDSELKDDDLHLKVSDKEEEKIISKIDSTETKAYKLPFTSHCELENRDINDPKWNVYKKLETDEQRYYIVRKHWKSLIVPDPNENLTLHSYRRRRKNPKKEPKVEHILRKGKRSHDGDNSDIELPAGKRMRLFNDMSFNSEAIEKTLINLQHEYYEEKRAPYRSYNQLQKLDNAYEEYFRQMQNARQEAEMVHKFYTGLPNQKIVTQKEIEDEQYQIEKVYDLFKRYYNWSGKIFNPVIKR
ncbi:UNVERIFIED_CONTAM: hypothetical protein RMT77_019121 [Armadillidium vulgare]